MVMWPAVALVGFLVLTALVIAMGTQSTARYEAERRATAERPTRDAAPEASRAAVTATAVL
jgi:multisubunit Na+/H+ antiporter MnhC subunit